MTGLSDYYARQTTPEADAAALRWRNDQPLALYRQGMALANSDPNRAEQLFKAAAWHNPTNALPYLALADLWSHTKRRDLATDMVNIADVLGPLYTPALAQSASFWAQQNQLNLALARWGALLRTQPQNAAQLYPVLLQLAEESATRPLLYSWLADPPEWWDQFFAYVVATAIQPQTVMFLYQNRNRGENLPTADEQRIYLEWLRQKKRWLEMYLVWLSGLDNQQQRGLGSLYNGSFELPSSNLGFDWRITSPRGVTIEAVETYDMHGSKALHISFNGLRVRFQHVYQYLYLQPGQYLLTGRARPDSLQAERGLRWRLYCDENPLFIAESEPFVGSESWRNFEVKFTVPQNKCVAQLLRLELEGRTALEFEARGDAWFDDLAINQQK